MSVHIEALAFNLRRLRETHGLSLSQLGERSGVAKATLFKIERGSTNPTIDTLALIADTFNVSLPELVTVPPRAVVEVVRAGEGETFSDDASIGVALRNQVIGAGTLEFSWVVFHEGKSEVTAGHGAGSREHVLVQNGHISVGPPGEEVLLGPGDYATYPTDRGHRWRPEGGNASVWIVNTYPSSSFTEAEPTSQRETHLPTQSIPST